MENPSTRELYWGGPTKPNFRTDKHRKISKDTVNDGKQALNEGLIWLGDEQNVYEASSSD